jgi:hypothetical protein
MLIALSAFTPQVVQYLSSSQLCLAAARVVCACIRGLAYIQQNLLLPPPTQPSSTATASTTATATSSDTSQSLPISNGSSELQALAVGAAHAVLASRPLLSVLELPDKHVSTYCSDEPPIACSVQLRAMQAVLLCAAPFHFVLSTASNNWCFSMMQQLHKPS